MKPDAPPLPQSLQVEVTAACHLRCRMCLVRYRPPVDRVTGTMSLRSSAAWSTSCRRWNAYRAVLGRLADGPFPGLWRGQAYRRFREALLGADPPHVCRGCSLYRGVFSTLASGGADGRDEPRRGTFRSQRVSATGRE